MKAEILATGDEIRSGALVDSNSAYISQKLEETGVEVTRHITVGDDKNILVSTIKEISQRADIAVVTGGLGPTQDDLSSEAAAGAAAVDLVLDPQALVSMEVFFKKRKHLMSVSNKKQAMLPKGALCINNPVGTAPGFSIKINRCTFFFLPGVPFEMKKMLSASVLPQISSLFGHNRQYCMVKTISTFGLTEAATGETLADLPVKFPGVKIGFRSKFPEIQIKVYVYGKEEQNLLANMEGACEYIHGKIGNKVFSVNGGSMESEVGRLLADKKATLAVAESCTGGLISHMITNVSGSSGYFVFACTTYSNESKMSILGVSKNTLNTFGAVHEETAKEMAKGARRISGATYGLATSGIAGPGGGTDDKPVGTVCIGLATENKEQGVRYYYPFPTRSMNKTIFAMKALDILRMELI